MYNNPAWRQFKKHKLALISAAILSVLILISIFGPSLLKKTFGTSYGEIHLSERFLPPSIKHPLGTNELGKDLFMLITLGGRVSLSVGIISAITCSIIGTLIGSFAGYYGGTIDNILMRFTDVMLSLPILALMIIMTSIDITSVLRLKFFEQYVNPDIIKIIIVVAFFGWMSVARLVRGCILSLKNKEFVEAAKTCGLSDILIIFKHLIPNTISPIIVCTTLQAGWFIIYESVLSFLGLGIQPPVPSWGNILQRSQEYILIGKAPWLTIFPGLFIFITVICFNFLGDGLRDALDPKSKK